MRPYADNTFYIIGMKKGWFKDVGITFDPAPYGLKANDSNVTTLLLNGQLDIISEFCPLMLPTYKDANKLKCIAFTDNFLANAILANPALKLKTFKDYVGRGQELRRSAQGGAGADEGQDASRRAGAQRPSRSRNTSTQTADAGFKLQVLDDAKSLVLAKAGREDFVNPEGAPIVYTLRQAGWTNLVDIGDLIKHGPGGVDSPIEPLIGIVGIGGNSDYLNSHQNSVLRFLSVVWRIIDATKKDPSLYDLQAPYLNSMAGTSLDGKGVADTVAILHPFTDVRRQQAILRRQEEHDLLRQRLERRDQELRGAQHHSRRQGDARRRRLGRPDLAADGGLPDEDRRPDEDSSSGATLTPEKQKLVDKAKTFYADFDFLDAYRLALAASS